MGNSSKIYINSITSNPLTIIDPNDNVTHYIYGPKGIVAKRNESLTYYLLKDHLGSTRVVMNENNQAISSYDYDAWGNPMNSTVSEESAYRYTGREYDDETCLHNFRARLYDSTLMRFYQVDPAEQFASPYVYCGNNPINMTDQDGNWAEHSRLMKQWIEHVIPNKVLVYVVNQKTNRVDPSLTRNVYNAWLRDGMQRDVRTEQVLSILENPNHGVGIASSLFYYNNHGTKVFFRPEEMFGGERDYTKAQVVTGVAKFWDDNELRKKTFTASRKNPIDIAVVDWGIHPQWKLATISHEILVHIYLRWLGKGWSHKTEIGRNTIESKYEQDPDVKAQLEMLEFYDDNPKFFGEEE